jgi:hypothetical protein
MIYTCYDMIRDCRADKPEGWAFFITTYSPIVRRLLTHYTGDATQEIATLNTLRPKLRSFEPMADRQFVAVLRQEVLAQLPAVNPEIALDLESVAKALAPLTLVEKQAAWFETMRYDAAAAAAMLRVSAKTVESVRGRAAELIRGVVDAWRQTLLAENGMALGRTAAAASTKDCFPPKPFLDVIDGRATWQAREDIERHVSECWHCIDHYCRLIEVRELLRA